MNCARCIIDSDDFEMPPKSDLFGDTKKHCGDKCCPSFQSALYYAVVISVGRYKGYAATYVGIGKMTFFNEATDDTFITDHNLIKQGQNNEPCWMELCWNDFLEYIEMKGL